MKALLTPTEIEFLLGRREFTKDQQYYIKSRILKKVKALYGVELPLLQDKGYLGLAACSKCGISTEIVDFLQGRVSASVFSRHYLTPDASLKDRVLTALHELEKSL